MLAKIDFLGFLRFLRWPAGVDVYTVLFSEGFELFLVSFECDERDLTTVNLDWHGEQDCIAPCV